MSLTGRTLYGLLGAFNGDGAKRLAGHRCRAAGTGHAVRYAIHIQVSERVPNLTRAQVLTHAQVSETEEESRNIQMIDTALS